MRLLQSEEPAETATALGPDGREAMQEPGVALETAQAEDRAWRAERREQVASSLEQVEGRYAGVTDFLTRLGTVMGVVFVMGIATVILLTCLGGAHLAGVGALLMAVGLGAAAALAALAGLCWLVWTGIDRVYRRWARWQAIDLDARKDEKG